MSYSIQGKVIDTDKNPIPFALVYTSDASGKPVTPSKNTQTDDKGFWKLNDLKDTDLISVRNLGYKMKTFLAKNVPNVSFSQFMPPQRSVVTTLQPDESLNLQEVVVVSDKIIPKKEETKKDVVILPKKKNNYGLYVLIAGVLLITTALILNKKTTK
jgi:hypothetical protein